MKSIIERVNSGKSNEVLFAHNLKRLLVDEGIASSSEIVVEIDKTSQYLDTIRKNAKQLALAGKRFIIVHIGRSNKQSDVILIDLSTMAMQAFEVKSSYDYSKLFNPSFKTNTAAHELVGTGIVAKKSPHIDAICQTIADSVAHDKMFKDFMSIMAKHSIDFPFSRAIPQFKDAVKEFTAIYPNAVKRGSQSIDVSSPVFSSRIDDICYSYYMLYASAINKVPTPYMQIGSKNRFGMVNSQIFQIAKSDNEIPVLKLQSTGRRTVKKLSDFFGGFIVRLRLRTRGGSLNADNWIDPTQCNLIAELNFAKEPIESLCNLDDLASFPMCKLV